MRPFILIKFGRHVQLYKIYNILNYFLPAVIPFKGHSRFFVKVCHCHARKFGEIHQRMLYCQFTTNTAIAVTNDNNELFQMTYIETGDSTANTASIHRLIRIVRLRQLAPWTGTQYIIVHSKHSCHNSIY